ncbi:MAG: PD-(D/E)XK nuclease family protein, partial [Candidatus Dormibacteria bacterium]
PHVPPDWRRAPAKLPPLAVASAFDRSLGVAVHIALARWQRAVEGGAKASVARLLAEVCTAATRAGLAEAEVERSLARLNDGLHWYAAGPWPRRSSLFLEQRVSAEVAGDDGFSVRLNLRIDRVTRYRRSIAILDFKTVTPHQHELAADSWQLQTYALAAPGLIGVGAEQLHLFLVDLQAAAEVPVRGDAPALRDAREKILEIARRIREGDFDVTTQPDRPCWSCGFRLDCPSSLAPTPPSA